MDHQIFHGTHDEAGYEWGRKLLREGRSLLADVPFPVTKERVRFAEACRPFYEKWYPEVLEEIRGIAAGQQAEQKELEAVLLGMYAILPENRCSCLAFQDGAHMILGRNSDFLAGSEQLSMNCIYRLDEEHSFVAAVNAFHLDAMTPYRAEGIDDWNAEERYRTIHSAFASERTADAVSFAMDVLRGTYGFLCQYDPATGKDTVWSSVYDVGARRIWRCEGNPSRKEYEEDGRFVF